jgi:pimeloyl-ACP methyl ester carboxylesterase
VTFRLLGYALRPAFAGFHFRSWSFTNKKEDSPIRHPLFYLAELNKIKCPVFIAVGENDQLTPVKFSKLLLKQMPHAEFVIVPECGHTTIYEKPEVVNSMALGFISKNT